MNIIVTGGAGFLGRHLCRALANAGHSLKIIDLKNNPEFETIIADVRDTNKMKELVSDAEVVFHLASLIEAGESVEKPEKYIDYNINGTLSILEAMRLNGIKTFVFSSSAAIYGEPTEVPIKEDDRTLPINPYGMTKLAMEALLRSYVEAHNFTGVALRYFNLYGPEEHHQPETHAIPRFIKQIYENEEVTIWGDGSHQRDYVYITDIVDAHLKTLELIAQQPEQYHYLNLSTENPSSVIQVVETIEQAMNKKANIKHHDPRPGDPLKLYADASKAKNVLGWQSKHNLKSGLENTVQYFINYWEGNS
ncbi:MAG: UDP-glucose 4-epimerase [Candidatus Pacebacteria bacterium]|jgi:UDP-glucose 4-epimerase|nr:UDP-glucose 4-epimerase [Candidatus Paceibacterota bacterium]MBT4004442.1 UDP-glucose 4-epimerase [Candidatus Paceibacterota bacterium]MBT4358554.1 UDP-glucose 4-epimerase [Candidatus Paceibacterota bacterium]MBT6898845.1 UDP-glucose 4-epimerase [Candidatus Paceibacterota bacterium]MBT7499401.1 UDP-glucose 4-epimerase [Candidatus Paceibacterota bacterium]